MYIKDELFLALGTASTEVVLPRIMAKLTERRLLPHHHRVWWFRRDTRSTSTARPCTCRSACSSWRRPSASTCLGEQITAVLVLMLTSKGMAGVPGSSFLALSATVAAIGHCDPGCRGGAAAGCGPDHGLDAGVGEPARQLRRDLRGGELGGPLDKERMRKVLNGEDVPPLTRSIR